MCGIIALANVEKSLEDYNTVIQTMDQVRHRGPDGLKVISVGPERGPSIVLGHARLAIVGGENALQPLSWIKGRSMFHLTVNGEIYNYQELKEQLVRSGCCTIDDFSTEGDSEVMLACFVHRGIAWTLENIRGMFAFVLVETTSRDEEIQTISLGRDVMGIKPLSFGMDQDRRKICITSEIAAMPRNYELNSVKDVLPSTFVHFEKIVVDGALEWSVIETAYGNRMHWKSIGSQKVLESGEQASMINRKLTEAVSIRIPRNGVRWGILLSGGLDSSLIARIAADLVNPSQVYTFTITFLDENSQSHIEGDRHYAKIVAGSRSNITHEEVTFTFQEGLDVLPHVINAVESTDVALVRASVPLYILSKHISKNGFKVVLCGEGADECFGGYRLFEKYSNDDCSKFSHEIDRRLLNIDTSELQRVDRCTSAHGLEARVPFLDTTFLETIMGIDHTEKMSHPSRGKVSKFLLRRAFDGYLPDSVLYREKEQFADGIGSQWISRLQAHTFSLIPTSATKEVAETTFYTSHFYSNPEEKHPHIHLRENLMDQRKARRRISAYVGSDAEPGTSQSSRWHKVQNDPDLQRMKLSSSEVKQFIRNILGWSNDDIKVITPSVECLNKLIVSMLARVPFHNLTLLTRERRPPTMDEIKNDMMTGMGGPCSVVNSFFALLLSKLGFPHVYLLSCQINGRSDCHVAILLQIKGLRYFVDVANAKPYYRAVQIGDSTVNTCLNISFLWNLEYEPTTGVMEVRHGTASDSLQSAMTFHPTTTVMYSSFHNMIKRSRNDREFGPFLTGLRLCIYPNQVTEMIAVRDACIYDGDSMREKRCAQSKADILSVAKRDAFAHIRGFDELVTKAMDVLDVENADWFEISGEILRKKRISNNLQLESATCSGVSAA